MLDLFLFKGRTVERVNALAAALVANLAAKTLDAAKTHDEESGKGPASQSDSREKVRQNPVSFVVGISLKKYL